MKNPWEWNESDLLDNIANGWKESIDLDFKHSDALQNTDGKKNEISKDVSAFANSAGGTIIYGVAEDGYIAQGIDGGSDPTLITKEWLENVIDSRIQRRIDGIRINQVDLITTSPGKVAYVVNIQQSIRAPHQASDKRFYKRFNFKSIPMEEYEVRDISRRVETPDLRIEFSLNKPPNYTQGPPASQPFSLHAVISNKSLEVAKYALIEIIVDRRLNIINSRGLSINQNNELPINIEDKTTHPITTISFTWSLADRHLPIFQTPLSLTVFDQLVFKTPEHIPLTQQNYLLGYRIQSPRMTPKVSFTLLTVASNTIKFSDKYISYEELQSVYSTIEWE